MAIKVECEHCGARLNLKDESKVGKRIKCPKCQQPFTIAVLDDEFGDEFGDLPDDPEEPVLPKKKSGGSGKKGKKGGKGKGKKKQESSSMLLPLLIGGGVLALLLIGGLVFFLTRGGDELVVAENPTTPEAPATTEEAMPSSEEMSAEASTSETTTPAKPEPVEAVATNPNTLNTQWLPKETQVVIHLKPSVLLKAPILQRVLESEAGKAGLASFKDLCGFGIETVDEVTIGIAPDLNELAKFSPAGPAGATPTGTDPIYPSEGSTGPSSDATMEAYKASMANEGLSGMGRPPGSVPAPPKMIAVLRMSMDVDIDKVTFASKSTGGDEYPQTGFTPDYTTEPSQPGSTFGGTPETSPSGEGSMKAPAQLYNVAMPGPGPRLKLSLPDKKTMVFGEQKYIQEALAAKGSQVGDKFQFISKDETFVIAGLLEFMPIVRKQLKEQGGKIPAESEKFFKLYDQGAQAGYLAFELNEGVTVKTGLAGKDEAAGKAIQAEFASLEQLMKAGYQEFAESFPKGFQEPLKTTIDSLKVVQDASSVQFEATLTAGLFEEIQNQTQKLGGQMAMAMAQGMLASKMGPGFSPGGGLFPGGMGEPVGLMPVLDGSPVPATTVTGLPEDVELAALVNWDPNQSNGLNLNLILEGDSKNLVQYRNVHLIDSTWESGEVVKNARAKPMQFVTSHTWNHTNTYRLNDKFEIVNVVSLPVYLPVNGNTISQLKGDLTLQSASDVEEIQVDLSNPANFASPEIEAAGIRIVVSGDQNSQSYYILPTEEGVAVVSVELVGDSKTSRGIPAGYASGNYELNMEDPSSIGNNIYPEGYSEGSGLLPGITEPGGTQTVQKFEKILGVSRPNYLNPVGFVVAFEKQKASTVLVRIAKGLQDHEVHFEFSNIPLPKPPVTVVSTDPKEPTGKEPTGKDLKEIAEEPPVKQIWTGLAEDSSAPEGFQRIEATGTWHPVQDDNKRQNLDVVIDLVGPKAELIMSVLNYGVDECFGDDDKKLVFDEKSETLKEGTRIERLTHSATVPLNTYRVTFPFNVVSPTFEKLKSLRGELRLQVANQQVPVQVESLKEFEGKRILQPQLLKEKIFLDLATDEETKELVFKLDARSGTKVASLSLIDEAGNVQPEIPQTLTVDEKGVESFRFNIGEESIKSYGVQVVINQGGETVRVPFHFVEMPLPPAPVEE